MGKMPLPELEQNVQIALAGALDREFGRAVVARVIVLFGSRALARDRASSDVDLAVALDTPINEFQRQRIEASIALALGVDTDLVDLSSAPSHLVSRILRSGRILAGAGSPALGAMIAKMVSQREDIVPYQRRILEERAR